MPVTTRAFLEDPIKDFVGWREDDAAASFPDTSNGRGQLDTSGWWILSNNRGGTDDRWSVSRRSIRVDEPRRGWGLKLYNLQETTVGRRCRSLGRQTQGDEWFWPWGWFTSWLGLSSWQPTNPGATPHPYKIHAYIYIHICYIYKAPSLYPPTPPSSAVALYCTWILYF